MITALTLVLMLANSRGLEPATTQPTAVVAALIDQYELMPGVAVRRIAGPYTDARDAACRELADDASLDTGRITLVVERGQTPTARVYSIGTPRLGNILMHVIGLPSNEFTFTAAFANTKIDGDWIIDPRASVDARMRDFATIVSECIGRPISLQRVREEVDCVVVRGSFKPALTETNRMRRIELPIDRVEFLHWINIDQCPIGEFAQRLSYATGWPVFDETTRDPEHIGLIDYGSPKNREHVGDGEMRRTDPEQMKVLIDAIAQQTGFDFRIERRTVERWQLRD